MSPTENLPAFRSRILAKPSFMAHSCLVNNKETRRAQTQRAFASRDLMKEVIQYASRFQPRFANSIQGCTLEEIQQLEDVYSGHLTDEYREYLAYMGRNNGDLDKNVGFMDYDTILKRFIQHAERKKPFPRNAFVVCHKYHQHQDLVLTLPTEDNEESLVYLAENESLGAYHALSLKDQLLRNAFIKFRLQPCQKPQQALVAPQTARSGYRMALRKNDFHFTGFSDDVFAVATRTDGSFVVFDNQNTNKGRMLRLRVFSRTADSVKDIVSLFSR